MRILPQELLAVGTVGELAEEAGDEFVPVGLVDFPTQCPSTPLHHISLLEELRTTRT